MRQVLFDEDVPRQLRRDLQEFKIRTVQEEGWSSVKNGELLRLSSSTFDVFVAADKRLRFQQNIARFDIGVVVIATWDTRLPRLQQHSKKYALRYAMSCPVLLSLSLAAKAIPARYRQYDCDDGKIPVAA